MWVYFDFDICKTLSQYRKSNKSSIKAHKGVEISLENATRGCKPWSEKYPCIYQTTCTLAWLSSIFTGSLWKTKDDHVKVPVYQLRKHQIEYLLFAVMLQTFGIILTLGMGGLINKVSILAGNISVVVALFIGTIGTGKYNLYDQLI